MMTDEYLNQAYQDLRIAKLLEATAVCYMSLVPILTSALVTTSVKHDYR